MRVLGPKTDFPPCRSSKGTENSQHVSDWFWRPVGLVTELPQDKGNRRLEGTDTTLCALGPRSKEQWGHERGQWVFRSLCWRRVWTVACHGFRTTDSNSPGTSPFEWGRHYHHGHHCFFMKYGMLCISHTYTKTMFHDEIWNSLYLLYKNLSANTLS